jgi:uncharacterized protein YcfL
MKKLYIKLLIGLLIVISCSKESEDIINPVSIESNQQASNQSSTNTSTSSTNTSTSSTNTSTSSTNTSSQSETFDRGTILSN